MSCYDFSSVEHACGHEKAHGLSYCLTCVSGAPMVAPGASFVTRLTDEEPAVAGYAWSSDQFKRDQEEHDRACDDNFKVELSRIRREEPFVGRTRRKPWDQYGHRPYRV